MSDAALETKRRARITLSLPPLWPLVCVVFGVLSLLTFAYLGVRYTDETQREMRLLPWLRYDQRVDFAYFYAGAKMVWHGDVKTIYPEKGELTFYPEDPIFLEPHDDYTLARLMARGNYYNPPALAYLQAPLSTLQFRDAFYLFSGLALAALALFMYLSWRAGRGIPELPFLLVGILAFRPAHEALIMGHMTLFFVAILGGGLLLLRAEKPVLAGLVFSLLALKPQWAVLPGLFLLVRGEWKAAVVMGVWSLAIVFLPFVAIGQHTLENWIHFLRWQSALDLKDAPHMFSWNGFLFKQEGGFLYGHPPPDKSLIYGLIALTAVPLLLIWWSRDYLLGAAGTVIAMLLISTHSVWYDWALLVVAALFLVLRAPQMARGMRVEMWVVLLALLIATGDSIGRLLAPDRHAIDWHAPAFYWATPVAFAALCWLALIPLRERGLRSFLRPPWSKTTPASA